MARGTGAQLTEEQLAAGANRFQITEREEGSGIFNTLRHAIINLPASVAQEVGYVAEMIEHPLDTGEALLRVAAGYAQKALPNSWEQYLPEDWATNKMYAEAINQHYIDRYGSLEGALDAIAEEPVSVALDVFIVGGVLKATAKQATKVSAALNKAANNAKGTVLEGELAQRAANATAVSTEVKAAAEASRVAEAESVILVYDKASGVYVPAGTTVGEAAQVGKGAVPVGEGTVIPMAGEVAKASETTYPIRNQAQQAAVEARLADDVAYYNMIKQAESRGGDFEGIGAYYPEGIPAEVIKAAEAAELSKGMITSSTRLDDAVKAETAALAAEAGGVVDLSVLPNYSRLAKAAEIDDFARISRTAELAKAGEVAKIGEAYGLARTAAGDMYPAIKAADLAAQTGMVTRIPNISRPWKAAEIADKAAIPYQTIARTVKAAEMADQFKEPFIPAIDIPVAPDKGINLTPDKPKSPYQDMPPYEKSIQDIKPAAPINERPGWKLPHQFDREPMVEGNYWSADFEDEYWNTPAGVQEAIGVWGRPVGNRIGNPVRWEW